MFQYHLFSHKKSPNKKNKIFFVFLSFLIIASFSTALFAGALANAALEYYTRDMPSIDILLNWNPPETTKIFSKNGTLLYQPQGSEVRTVISFDKIPDNLKNAFVAVEDMRFWQHQGIDPKRIFSVMLHDIESPDDLQGASTITQQLIKNCLLTNKKTVRRKIQEIILAYSLERHLSKEKILELYLNQIPFGSNIYGVEAASQKFWSKSASEINLMESAILAALAKATTTLSPYENKELLIERAKLVLDLMYEQKLILKESAENEKEREIAFKSPDVPIIHPHFSMYTLGEIEKRFGKEAINSSGLQVFTTIDDNLQKIAEEIIKETAGRIKKLGASNAALIGLDARTGQILAMVGSINFWSGESGQYNVTTALRQPGSTFKPLVYVSAFDTEKFTPDSIVNDSFVNFRGYKPNNFDFTYHGNVTIRSALANSYNIPAVKTLDAIGLNYFKEKMSLVKIEIKDDTGLPAALGAEATSLLNMAAAFASFANNGKYNPPSAFLKITNKNGDLLEEFKNSDIPAFSEKSAEMITSILSDYSARAQTFGSLRHRLELSDRPVAAKTGTTDSRRDAWTIGYTPDLVCAVWVGNNDNSPMNRKAEGITAAAPIWKEFMEKATKDTEIEEF